MVVSEAENAYGVMKSNKQPTCPSANGSGTIIWYTAVKQADGTYKAQVTRDHKYSTGEYTDPPLLHVQNVMAEWLGSEAMKTTAM